jgi:hypothetical protein
MWEKGGGGRKGAILSGLQTKLGDVVDIKRKWEIQRMSTALVNFYD